MNSRPPRSRTRCTHPSSTTSAPTSPGRRAPQVCVRVSSPSCSATFLHVLENGRPRGGLVVGLLGLGGQVLDRHGTCRDFVAAKDGDKRNAAGISVLDLLADLVGLRIHE